MTSKTRQANYERRQKQGITQIPKPWDWLTLAQVQAFAADAYKVASFELNEERGHIFNPAYFANELVVRFGQFVAVEATKAGMSASVVEGMGANDKALVRSAATLRKKVADWKPQYPLYQKLTPASVCTASGAVITADEGNGNETEFKRS